MFGKLGCSSVFHFLVVTNYKFLTIGKITKLILEKNELTISHTLYFKCHGMTIKKKQQIWCEVRLYVCTCIE